MDFTGRMVALLARMRRERNGAVAEEMRYYGAAYGLNYGVSLPTLRDIARSERPDHDFARYLYLQDVRELRLAALHIAQPERLTRDEFSAWAAGIVNSEVAEEAAFALLSRVDALPELFAAWIAAREPLLNYAALMAASRSRYVTSEWIDPALEAVRRNDREAVAGKNDPSGASAESSTAPSNLVVPTVVSSNATPLNPAQQNPAPQNSMPSNPAQQNPVVRNSATPHVASPNVSPPNPAPQNAEPAASQQSPAPCAAVPAYAGHLTALGAVALLAAIGMQNEENRRAVLRATGSPGKLPAEDYVHEELAWRLAGD